MRVHVAGFAALLACVGASSPNAAMPSAATPDGETPHAETPAASAVSCAEGQDLTCCLDAPWAPLPSEAPEMAGLVHTLVSPRMHELVRRGTRPWTLHEIDSFVHTHQHELFAVSPSASDVSFSWGIDRVTLEVRRCAVRLDVVAEAVSAMVRATVPPDAEVRIDVELVGPLAPRCARGAHCGPLPLDPARTDPPPAARDVLSPSTDACTHDGECVLTGCGSICAGWREGERVGSCVGDTSYAEAWCGCVEGHCATFHAP
jgi:hypothetical protein